MKPPRLLPALAGIALALAAARPAAAGTLAASFGGRPEILYMPARLPPPGQRALVVVLHGGLGNAAHIAAGRAEAPLNMDAEAERDGFVVAYLDGTRIARLLPAAMLGWNAGGGCCGLPAREGVDDVAYIAAAVRDLVSRHGIDPARVFAMGHSNGAMMTQRMLCETGVFAAGVAISGPLNLSVPACPAAHGRRVLAIHGAEDRNVPVAGGRGSLGISGVAFESEANSRRVFTASGASYDLRVVPGGGHELAGLDVAFRRETGQSIPAAVAGFFGLSR
jgi:poly(3-hydroxybutyrate) depolymerase